MAAELTDIDWSAPWLADWAPAGQRIGARLRDGVSLWDAINLEQGLPVRAVAPGELPVGEGYEMFVARTGCCPTREGLHDLFNALCWRHLPLTKQRMNALHVESVRRSGGSPLRGAVRDAITLLDENGALLCAPAPIWQALRARDWRRLFIELRPLWREARLTLVGHALAEKLMHPRKAITAHVWDGEAPEMDAGQRDEWLAHQLKEDTLAAKPFVPLPVLGIPGWWPGNELPGFYDDPAVFRPARPSGGADLKSARGAPPSRGEHFRQPLETQ